METINTFNTIKDFIDSPFSAINSWIGEKISTSIISLIDGSYWIFLGISMSALFLYVAGQKGAKKYTTTPPLIYFLLQLLKISLQ